MNIDKINKLSQKKTHFTLFAGTRKGNRPSFIDSARTEQLKIIYDEFNGKLRKENVKVETGIFRAIMDVLLINNRPVIIIIDSKNR